MTDSQDVKMRGPALRSSCDLSYCTQTFATDSPIAESCIRTTVPVSCETLAACIDSEYRVLGRTLNYIRGHRAYADSATQVNDCSPCCEIKQCHLTYLSCVTETQTSIGIISRWQ